MGDPGFVSGLIGLGITVALNELAEYIKLAVYCKKELHKLEQYLRNIAPLNTAIQRYRTRLKLGQIVSHETETLPNPAVNQWLKKLDSLVKQATEIAQQCCIRLPIYKVISRYRMSLRIRQIIADIEEHLKQADLIGITTTLSGNEELGRGIQRIEQRLDDHDLGTAATSSNYPTQRVQTVNERLIVGQNDVFLKLQRKLTEESQGLTCLGVVAMGGAGKTLLLKTVLNSEEVQDSFKQDLVLWLTVSHNPSLSDLGRSLGKQIALQIKEAFDERRGQEEYWRAWIREKMKSRRFLLFLDDVWENSSDNNLLEALGVPFETVGNCKLVVSARDSKVLANLGVTVENTISLPGLSEDQSWALFSSHAFAYNNNEVPSVTVEETARQVCRECDGLPLAIKVIAATMAGVRDPTVWVVTLQRLQDADKLNSNVAEKLYNRLRLSYDALAKYDPTLQLCYLYIGAFKEDEDMYVEDLINLWIGEGLLTISRPGYDPLEIGRVQVNVLLDRCLIEGSLMDADGQVMVCSMHDVLHDLALQIAQEEENCYYRAGRNLKSFPDDCAGRSRISLMENNFASVPDSFQGGQVLSMLLSENKNLTQFPARAMATMSWVRVLDLGGTSLQELPSSFGCMKQLVCLRLARLPIKKLPESITKLRKLQILDLSTCNQLERLPWGIDKLVSLRYLDLSHCQHLQSLPCGISRLTSLQYLRTEGSWQAWEPRATVQMESKLCFRAPERAACFKDLQTLTQLKWLGLEEARARIEPGTLGAMIEMRTLVVTLAKMTALPDDMTAMTKIKTLFISCRDLIKTPPCLSEFEHLGCLILSACDKLQQLSALHKLPRLRRLDIGGSWDMKDLPQEFGEAGAFPALERFWVEKMYVLEKLPVLIEGAMPRLKILGVVICPHVEMLPDGFFKLQHLQQIQVYSSTKVLQRMEEGGQDWEVVTQLQNNGGVQIVKEFGGHSRLTDISTRMGNKYWWDRFAKEMWMNFHI